MTQDQQAQTNAGVARASGVVSLGNITSRVLGLAREIALTNLFGASSAVDAFNIAVLIPKAFYDLLIGGHVNSALVPVLSEAEARGDVDFWELVSVLLSFVSVLVTMLATLLVLFAPAVVRLFPSETSPTTLVIATDLLRLTAPALLFLSLFAVLSGTLYAIRSFFWSAFAGAIFNASIFLVTLLLAPWIGIRGAAIGWLVGAVCQFLLQLPGLRHSRLRLSFRWSHPGLRQIGLLYAPVLFSLVIDTFVIRLFSYRLANSLGEGSISYMGWATTLIQFPHGLVATAISIAILPTLSRQAAQAETQQPFRDTLGLGLRLTTVLILPATLGLFVLGTPIVRLLFEHGQFGAADTLITVQALRLYLFGLPFAGLDLLLIYAFYARQDTLTPAWVGLVSLVVYMVVALGLVTRYGLYSLMIADSVKHLTHTGLSAVLLWQRLKGFGKQNLGMTMLKSWVASCLMGAVGWLIVPPLQNALGLENWWAEILLVLLPASLCMVVYVGLSFVFRLNELLWLVNWARQRR